MNSSEREAADSTYRVLLSSAACYSLGLVLEVYLYGVHPLVWLVFLHRQSLWRSLPVKLCGGALLDASSALYMYSEGARKFFFSKSVVEISPDWSLKDIRVYLCFVINTLSLVFILFRWIWYVQESHWKDNHLFRDLFNNALEWRVLNFIKSTDGWNQYLDSGEGRMRSVFPDNSQDAVTVIDTVAHENSGSYLHDAAFIQFSCLWGKTTFFSAVLLIKDMK